MCEDLSQVPNVLVRAIGKNAADHGPPSVISFDLIAGDLLLLFSKGVFHAPDVTTHELVAAANRLALDDLLELASRGDAPFGAAAAIRV